MDNIPSATFFLRHSVCKRAAYLQRNMRTGTSNNTGRTINSKWCIHRWRRVAEK